MKYSDIFLSSISNFQKALASYFGFDLTLDINGYNTDPFIGYFIPMGPVIVILGFLIGTYVYRLIVSVLKLLWSIIPLL